MVKEVKRFIKYLEKNKIPYGRHYPKPVHKLSAVKKLFLKKKFKNAEKLAKECISLPTNILFKNKRFKICLWCDQQI